MIHSHLYVKHANTPVYDSPDVMGSPVGNLERGNWVGVLETMGDWVRVIGVHCIGWVKTIELESRPPFDLHIHQNNSHTIEYVNSID